MEPNMEPNVQNQQAPPEPQYPQAPAPEPQSNELKPIEEPATVPLSEYNSLLKQYKRLGIIFNVIIIGLIAWLLIARIFLAWIFPPNTSDEKDAYSYLYNEDYISSNTDEKVKALEKEAKDAIKETASVDELTEDLNEALTFIVQHYPNYYDNNKLMEQTIYNGYLLEHAFKRYDDDNSKNFVEVGKDTVKSVKYVYLKMDKKDDSATLSNLEQLKKSLANLGITPNK